MGVNGFKTLKEILRKDSNACYGLLFMKNKANVPPRFISHNMNGRRKETLMKKLKYYIFCIKWLWKNRTWENTRQKFKAMEKAWKKEVKKVVAKSSYNM